MPARIAQAALPRYLLIASPQRGHLSIPPNTIGTPYLFPRGRVAHVLWTWGADDIRSGLCPRSSPARPPKEAGHPPPDSASNPHSIQEADRKRADQSSSFGSPSPAICRAVHRVCEKPCRPFGPCQLTPGQVWIDLWSSCRGSGARYTWCASAGAEQDLMTSNPGRDRVSSGYGLNRGAIQ